MSLKKDAQRQMLVDIAHKHGILLAQADEVWKLFEDKIVDVIEKEDKLDENGLYDVSKIKVIHIDNFGKFIPSKKIIGVMNRYRKERFKNEGNT